MTTNPTSPEEETKLAILHARNASIMLEQMINALPASSHRTSARARVQEATEYLQRILDHYGE